eukprot:COSAG03_NODE_7957_length_851_cov_3.936170_1_plen_149_part_00
MSSYFPREYKLAPEGVILYPRCEGEACSGFSASILDPGCFKRVTSPPFEAGSRNDRPTKPCSPEGPRNAPREAHATPREVATTGAPLALVTRLLDSSFFFLTPEPGHWLTGAASSSSLAQIVREDRATCACVRIARAAPATRRRVPIL